MRRSSRKWIALMSATALAAVAVACGGGDDADEPAGGGGGAAAATTTQGPAAGADAAMCELPTTPITCTTGDDSPCTATCGVAYCYTFGGGGGGGAGSTICTRGCNTAEQCPTGWTCNGMGRCRNP